MPTVCHPFKYQPDPTQSNYVHQDQRVTAKPCHNRILTKGWLYHTEHWFILSWI